MKKIFILFLSLCGIAAMGQKVVDPNTKSVPTSSCDCGTWGMLTVQTVAQAARYACGSTFNWSCKIPFKFTSFYQCNPNDKNCQAKTTWTLEKGGQSVKSGTGTNQLSNGFSLVENGIYTLTLNATCNGKKCPSCVYTIIVDDCVGRACVSILRDSLWCINEQTGRYGYKMAIQNFSGSNCYLQTGLIPNGGTLSGAGGLPVPSLPPGVSTVSGHFNGVVGVNNQLCLRFYCVQGRDSCSIVRCFTLPSCKVACACGAWGNLSVQSGAGVRRYACGSTINWSCKNPFNFTSVYQCNPDDRTCQAITTWTLEKGGQPVKTGTGTNQISDGFSLVKDGNYTLTLDASCEGKKCASCVYNIVIAQDDENCIPSVTICNQVWMLKNLDVTTYRNGDTIPQVTDNTAWANLTTGAWCYYNNDPAMGAIYGKLYNWYAVNDSRGLAPAGWHIPSDAEWNILIKCIDPSADTTGGAFPSATAGGAMKETGTTHWISPNIGATNSSGFTGLPGGGRFDDGSDGSFKVFGEGGWWWSATEWFASYVWDRNLYNLMSDTGRNPGIKHYGFSVRCVKN